MADLSHINLPNNQSYDLADAEARSAIVALVIPTKTSDLENDSGFMTGMTILSYGSSTWSDFRTAYNANKVVYCRASSNSNPATGSQTRLAFMAYVNNAENPTEVEFQYYRSVNAHTATQQGDQVYVYKLTSNGSWTVTVRESYSKVAAGSGLSSTYSNGTITLTAISQLPAVTATDDGKVLTVSSGAWAAVTMPETMTLTEAITGTSTTGKLISANVLDDWLLAKLQSVSSTTIGQILNNTYVPVGPTYGSIPTSTIEDILDGDYPTT